MKSCQVWRSAFTFLQSVPICSCSCLNLKCSPLCMRHSDEGWLHKAVDIEGQLHIIEELQVFEEQQPVNSLLISAKQVAQDNQTLV